MEVGLMKMSNTTPTADCEEAQGYPIIYRVLTWVRILIVIVALAFGLGWTYISFYPGYSQGALTFNPLLISIDVPVLALTIYGIAWAFTAQITLYANGFEQRKPLMRRMLNINDIEGRRYAMGRGGPYPVIVPKSGSAFSIDTSSYGLDERFNQWFMRLPDLQKIAHEINLERIKSDASLGATPDERIATDASRRRTLRLVGSILAVAAAATFYTAMFVDGHVNAYVSANILLPCAALALVIVYKDQAAGSDNGQSGFLVLPFLIPAASLAILAVRNARLMDPKGAIEWGFVIGLVVLSGALALLSKLDSSPRNRAVFALAMLPFCWMYGGSVLALANAALDGHPAQVIPTGVVGKHIQRGRSGRSYYLEIAGGTKLPQGASVRVEADQYFEAKEGDVICMAIHPGQFGLPWMKPTNCPGKDGPF